MDHKVQQYVKETWINIKWWFIAPKAKKDVSFKKFKNNICAKSFHGKSDEAYYSIGCAAKRTTESWGKNVNIDNDWKEKWKLFIMHPANKQDQTGGTMFFWEIQLFGHIAQANSISDKITLISMPLG